MLKAGNALKLLVLVILLEGCTSPTYENKSSPLIIDPNQGNPAIEASATPVSLLTNLTLARTRIKHIVIFMQENRSFDHYFGTFPGADGIPMQNGVPTVCAVSPNNSGCIKPYHDPNDINFGGPHTHAAFKTDVDGGKMDGFIQAFLQDPHVTCQGSDPNQPDCVTGGNELDVMGWHDAREIPNYWTYAKNFVLQDHMFEPNSSWSLPDHLFMVSGWSATCTSAADPMS